MFNYWTEGGFIAWGQQPDPNTGRTPLQLFMDGRAQAAYDRRAFDVWSEIMFGGRVGAQLIQNARIRKRGLTPAEYAEIGRWIDEQLKKHNVWAILMPMERKIVNGPFLRGIERNPNWQLVFFNSKQKLFVNVTTPQGKELLEGIFSNKILYPDDFSKNLTLARNMLLFGKGKAAKKQGLALAIKAFKLNPSQALILEIMSARRFGELIPDIDDFCKKYLDDFTENKDLYAKQHGYLHRITATFQAASHLQNLAKRQKNTKLVQFYNTKRKEYDNEIEQLRGKMNW